MSASVMIGMADRGIFDVDRLVFFLDVDRFPLPGACRGLLQLPLMVEQHVEIAHVPLGRVGRPGAFDTAGHGVRGQPRLARIGQPKPCASMRAASGSGTPLLSTSPLPWHLPTVWPPQSAPPFLHRSSPCGRRSRAHARGLGRVRLAVDAFRVHIDEAHMDGGQRVLQRRGIVESS
jgi:hypothetical protein